MGLVRATRFGFAVTGRSRHADGVRVIGDVEVSQANDEGRACGLAVNLGSHTYRRMSERNPWAGFWKGPGNRKIFLRRQVRQMTRLHRARVRCTAPMPEVLAVSILRFTNVSFTDASQLLTGAGCSQCSLVSRFG